MNTEKILVAYFAQKGNEETSNCARLAKKAEALLKEKNPDSDVFAIVPTEYYPKDEADMELASKGEQRLHVRPKLVGKYSGMKYVKKILLVVPNWWNALPAPVLSWLDDYDFNEKRIVPVISTKEDGAKIVEELRSFLPKTWIMEGVEIKEGATDEDVLLNKAVDELFTPDNH